MNDDTLIAVSAYSGDVAQVENNLPYYLHHGCPVVILSPSDAPITSVSAPGVHCRWVGSKGWAGPQTLVRHRLFLEMLLAFTQSWFLFHDSDSVCLSPQLPCYLYAEKAAWSNEVPDLNLAPSHLLKLAAQPPYFFHRDVLRALLRCAESPPPSYYGEVGGVPLPTDCIDHYHHQLTSGCGYPHRSFLHGASWETTSPLGLDEMAREVRYEGKIFIHQVKSHAALARLVAERACYLAR